VTNLLEAWLELYREQEAAEECYANAQRKLNLESLWLNDSPPEAISESLKANEWRHDVRRRIDELLRRA
jgi:hypothetical protein